MSIKETFSAGQTREFYGKGDFFRLLETTAEITVEFFNQGREVAEAVGVQAGYAEYFRVTPFDRIRIYSATAQNVKWVIREGSDVRYDRGASSVTGSVDLNAATIAQLRSPRPEAPTAVYKSTANITANTAEQLVSPGANINGIIVQEAKISIFGGATPALGAFISKAGAAPTNVSDGDPILWAGLFGTTSGGSTLSRGDADGDIWVPAGHGLYFICDSGLAVAQAAQMRMCRYRVL